MTATADCYLLNADAAQAYLRNWLMDNGRREESYSIWYFGTNTHGGKFVGWNFRTTQHQIQVSTSGEITEEELSTSE